MYTTNTAEATLYQLKHSRANIAVVDSEIQKAIAELGGMQAETRGAQDQTLTMVTRLEDTLLEYSVTPSSAPYTSSRGSCLYQEMGGKNVSICLEGNHTTPSLPTAALVYLGLVWGHYQIIFHLPGKLKKNETKL